MSRFGTFLIFRNVKKFVTHSVHSTALPVPWRPLRGPGLRPLVLGLPLQTVLAEELRRPPVEGVPQVDPHALTHLQGGRTLGAVADGDGTAAAAAGRRRHGGLERESTDLQVSP